MAARLQLFRVPRTSTAAGMSPARRPRVQVLLSVLPFAVMGAVAAANVVAGPGGRTGPHAWEGRMAWHITIVVPYNT